MPRAFLIARRRGPMAMETGQDVARAELSPERRVHIAEYENGHQRQLTPMSDGGCAAEHRDSPNCPEELYNLTKLAEVSLAAANGTLVVHPPSVPVHHPPAAYLAPPIVRLYDLPPPIVDEASDSKQSQRLPETERTSRATSSDPDSAGGDDHECPECGKRYSTSSNLARHRQTHRSLGDKKARRCPHCDKVYVSIPAYSMHVRTHNQGCKCHFCGKCFSRPWLLQGHIRTHTGEKPFKCTICNKAFADKSNLRAHIQTHSNTKPHVCSRCGKAFALKSYLYKHEESSCMRSHHHHHHHHHHDLQPKEQLPASPGIQVTLKPTVGTPTSVIVPTPRNPTIGEKIQAIRTSVISPNPEHLASRQLNLCGDPASRLSAFSKPQQFNHHQHMNISMATA